MPPWCDIPKPSVIGDNFAASDGLTFAFMNISKLSNEAESPTANKPVIHLAHHSSTHGRNFIQEELAILEPHIVITMNLKVVIGEKIASLGQLTPIHNSHQANSYWLDIGSQRSFLIDTFHFSAPSKNDIADYYVPICDAIRLSEASFADNNGSQ